MKLEEIRAKDQREMQELEDDRRRQGWPLWKALLVGLGLAAIVRLVMMASRLIWGA